MTHNLNLASFELVEALSHEADRLRIAVHHLNGGGAIYDFGVEAEGGLEAGIRLTETCMAGLGTVQLVPGEIAGIAWPQVQVTTDWPVAACLFSQYAGWQISVGDYFAMGSGAMRAAAVVEELFETMAYCETPRCTVGVLESARLPDEAVFRHIVEKTGVPADKTSLLVAPTSSAAGNLQVVSRSVETAMHKLYELGFDVNRLASAHGVAPLAPVAGDDLTGIGRTNDAILYGGRVTLWVRGDDASLAEIGPQVPSTSSESHGRPFLELFEEAGRDFYGMDPHLFSPAEIVFHNLETGTVQHFGRTAPEILRSSFGI